MADLNLGIDIDKGKKPCVSILPASDGSVKFRLMPLVFWESVAGGWLGSLWFGSVEVLNPASIMGVAVENIQSVAGVISA